MDKIFTAKEFLDKIQLMLDVRTIYNMGCFGAPLTYGSNLKRYSSNYDYNKKRADMYAQAVDQANKDGVPLFGGDCGCSVKGILWGWNADGNKVYGGAQYQSNGIPDTTINSLRDKYCEKYSKDFSTIVPGELVFYDEGGSHVGVYIGNGIVAENTPKWDNCFQT